jgi:hypothetical protein
MISMIALVSTLTWNLISSSILEQLIISIDYIDIDIGVKLG